MTAQKFCSESENKKRVSIGGQASNRSDFRPLSEKRTKTLIRSRKKDVQKMKMVSTSPSCVLETSSSASPSSTCEVHPEINESVRSQVSSKTRKKVKWGLLFRDTHAYASLSLTSLFFFYALTGFLANRSEWFVASQNENTQEVHVPDDVEMNKNSLSAFLKTLNSEIDSLQNWSDGDEGEIEVVGMTNKGKIYFSIDQENRFITRTVYLALPKLFQDNELKLLEWFKSQYGGIPGEVEKEDGLMSFELESVWGVHSFQVDIKDGFYTVDKTQAGFVKALIDIHRSKHASFFQKLLIDITALVLVFLTLTGAIIGIFYLSKKKRKIALVLNGFSIFLIVALLMYR